MAATANYQDIKKLYIKFIGCLPIVWCSTYTNKILGQVLLILQAVNLKPLIWPSVLLPQERQQTWREVTCPPLHRSMAQPHPGLLPFPLAHAVVSTSHLEFVLVSYAAPWLPPASLYYFLWEYPGETRRSPKENLTPFFRTCNRLNFNTQSPLPHQSMLTS